MAGPMLSEFLSAGDTNHMYTSHTLKIGGGQHFKTGLTVELYHTSHTQGAPNYEFMIAQCRDDWIHMGCSQGYSGMSQYQPNNVLADQAAMDGGKGGWAYLYGPNPCSPCPRG